MRPLMRPVSDKLFVDTGKYARKSFPTAQPFVLLQTLAQRLRASQTSKAISH